MKWKWEVGIRVLLEEQNLEEFKRYLCLKEDDIKSDFPVLLDVLGRYKRSGYTQFGDYFMKTTLFKPGPKVTCVYDGTERIREIVFIDSFVHVFTKDNNAFI